MQAFLSVVLRGVRDAYTWANPVGAQIGDRVVVPFRGRNRIGIVVAEHATTDLKKTAEVVEILDKNLVPKEGIALAQWAAEQYFCPVGKVLSLMLPPAFWSKEQPVKQTRVWSILGTETEPKGTKQKAVVAVLRRLGGAAPETELKDTASYTVLKNMAEKGYIKPEKGITPDPLFGHEERPSHDLTATQMEAYDQIKASEKPCLLWGVTGSGKTEVYKKLIGDALSERRGSILLVPEIGLTPQLISEMRGAFGSTVGVWHSRQNATEKAQTVHRVATRACRVLVGVRSGAWAPMPSLGLVIMDEEHEWTYHNQSAPRYATHSVAKRLCRKHNAKLVLGSATPRAESFHAATAANEYTMVQLPERVNGSSMPPISVVDMRVSNTFDAESPLSPQLVEALKKCISKEQKAVLLLNKRGMHQAMLCRSCGHHTTCPNCDSRMKLHSRGGNQALLCHICGHLERFKNSCPSCSASDYFAHGWGTQGVEAYMQKHLPSMKIARADADTTGTKAGIEPHLERLRAGEVHVLLGTQMVAKGLDFAGIGLVGVLNADVGLSLPDFRSEERVFQLITQVAGRAGRRGESAQIIIQTHAPEHPVFRFIKEYDTAGFLKTTLQQRAEHDWPPYGTVIKLTCTDPSKEVAFNATKALCQQLQATGANATWAPALFPRTHNKYHFHVFLRGGQLPPLLELLKEIELPRGVKIDTEPISVL